MSDVNLTEGAKDLFCAILEQNARDSQHISNALLEYSEGQALDLAAAFVAFYDLVDKAAAVVTTRQLEWALAQYSVEREAALRYLREHEKRGE